MKKLLKCALGFISGMAAAAVIVVSVMYYKINLKQRTIAEITDEATGYTVIFKEIGEPFLFGPSSVKVELKNKSGKTIDSFKDTISNDGGTLNEGNIKVYWRGEGAEIILSGEEQQNETYVLGCE